MNTNTSFIGYEQSVRDRAIALSSQHPFESTINDANQEVDGADQAQNNHRDETIMSSYQNHEHLRFATMRNR